jgi:Putative binding domain, N-terminal/NHL repeat
LYADFACTFSRRDFVRRTVGGSGGTSSVVLAYDGVWTAIANDSFLHLSAGSASGTGNSVVVFTYDPFTGTGTRTGTLTIAGLTLTVTQAGTNYIGPGPVTPLVSSGLNSPDGVAVDGAGNVYIADTSNQAIKHWSASTQQVTKLVSGSPLSSPYGVAVDSFNNVYIADASGIYEWNASTQLVSTLVSSGLSGPQGVAVDISGNVYFSDTGNNAIKEWSASTQQMTTLVSSGPSSPTGVAVDGSGNVYIADTGNNAVEEWSAATQQVTTLASGLGGPFGVAVNGSGNVYIADTGNHAVEEIPYAFVGPSNLTELAPAGSDSLLPVLPATQSLTGVFAPTSDQNWLTIGTVANGVINFSFTANTSDASRTANITILGQQITVTQNDLTPQAITFVALSNQSYGTAPFTVSATASSGLTVSFNSQTISICTMSGTTVTLVAGGTCTIQATQAGNTTYAAAPPVNQSFQVTEESQTITFGVLAPGTQHSTVHSQRHRQLPADG